MNKLLTPWLHVGLKYWKSHSAPPPLSPSPPKFWSVQQICCKTTSTRTVLANLAVTLIWPESYTPPTHPADLYTTEGRAVHDIDQSETQTRANDYLRLVAKISSLNNVALAKVHTRHSSHSGENWRVNTGSYHHQSASALGGTTALLRTLSGTSTG